MIEQVCNRCVMDTTASNIYFDEDGVCNYCSEFLNRAGDLLYGNKEGKRRDLTRLIKKIKVKNRNRKYDCIVGVSGGVDSSWVLVKTVELGLRPLAVHMDNGWNSELAQNNIENLIRELGVDLYTHVIDWNEYRALMQAFFDADVIDVELLYDNAMLALNYEQAYKRGIKTIMAGTNQATEGMKIPENWNWFKYDRKNIKSIAKSSDNLKINTFPAIGVGSQLFYTYFKKIKWVSFLDYLDYNKFEALQVLEQKYSYKRYPYKHYESIFTRFYQGYILPEKFNVDKRKVHFSTLIVSGQMTRGEAIRGLKGIAYNSCEELERDKNYFLKKMNWSEKDLTNYISRPEISHSQYSSEKPYWNILKKMNQTLKIKK